MHVVVRDPRRGLPDLSVRLRQPVITRTLDRIIVPPLTLQTIQAPRPVEVQPRLVVLPQLSVSPYLAGADSSRRRIGYMQAAAIAPIASTGKLSPIVSIRLRLRTAYAIRSVPRLSLSSTLVNPLTARSPLALNISAALRQALGSSWNSPSVGSLTSLLRAYPPRFEWGPISTGYAGSLRLLASCGHLTSGQALLPIRASAPALSLFAFLGPGTQGLLLQPAIGRAALLPIAASIYRPFAGEHGVARVFPQALQLSSAVFVPSVQTRPPATGFAESLDLFVAAYRPFGHTFQPITTGYAERVHLHAYILQPRVEVSIEGKAYPRTLFVVTSPRVPAVSSQSNLYVSALAPALGLSVRTAGFRGLRYMDPDLAKYPIIVWKARQSS